MRAFDRMSSLPPVIAAPSSGVTSVPSEVAGALTVGVDVDEESDGAQAPSSSDNTITLANPSCTLTLTISYIINEKMPIG
jgi:hypothetical protein